MESLAVLDLSKTKRARPALILLAAFCGSFVGFGSVVIFTFGIFLKPLLADCSICSRREGLSCRVLLFTACVLPPSAY